MRGVRTTPLTGVKTMAEIPGDWEVGVEEVYPDSEAPEPLEWEDDEPDEQPSDD